MATFFERVKQALNKKVIQSKQGKVTSDRTSVQTVSNRGDEQLPLVVIVGPTASGKSATAMKIAQEFNGEIICADSRSIYKGLDVGTAKPTLEDQALVPHWGLDLVEPGEPFTAADFKYFAQQKIAEIRERGHLPMLVGGTGLYIDGVVFDYDFVKSDPKLRQKLEQMSLDELKLYCKNNSISLPENQQNRRYVMRAIERKNISGKRLNVPIAHTIIVGITTERELLRQRIANRAEQLFENGMVEEAKKMGKKYGWKSEAMTGNIYPLVKKYLDGELEENELQQKFATADWQLAKRQITYLKRNQFIVWKPLDEAYTYIKTQLSHK